MKLVLHPTGQGYQTPIHRAIVSASNFCALANSVPEEAACHGAFLTRACRRFQSALQNGRRNRRLSCHLLPFNSTFVACLVGQTAADRDHSR